MIRAARVVVLVRRVPQRLLALHQRRPQRIGHIVDTAAARIGAVAARAAAAALVQLAILHRPQFEALSDLGQQIAGGRRCRGLFDFLRIGKPEDRLGSKTLGTILRTTRTTNLQLQATANTLHEFAAHVRHFCTSCNACAGRISDGGGNCRCHHHRWRWWRRRRWRWRSCRWRRLIGFGKWTVMIFFLVNLRV